MKPLLIIVWLTVSGCAFKEPGSGEGGGAAGARGVPGYSLTAVYGEGVEEIRELIVEASSGFARPEHPLVLPLPCPKDLKLRFKVRPVAGFDVRATVTANLDGETFKVSSNLLDVDATADALAASVEITGLGEKLALKPDQSFVLAVTFYTTADQVAASIGVRTIPATIKPTPVPGKMERLLGARVGPEESAATLRRWTLENAGPNPLTMRLPYQVEGKALRHIAETKSRSTGTCSGETKTVGTLERIPGRFLLVPDGASLPNFRKILSDPTSPTFELPIPPRSKAAVSLIFLADGSFSLLEKVGRCWTGPSQSIVFGCHNTTCREWHGEPSENCHENHKTGKWSCTERTVCDVWNTETDSPTALTDHTDILGTGYEIKNPFEGVGVRFADLPSGITPQAGRIVEAEARAVLAGSVDFAVPARNSRVKCGD